MSDLGSTNQLSTAMDTSATQEDVTPLSEAARRSIGLLRRIALVNLALVGLQSVSAGFLLSGYERAVTVHAIVALALEAGVLVQTITAVVLWRRRAPAWVAGMNVVLCVVVFLEAGLGHNKQYWLHVPLGVAIFGGLIRQAGRLETLRLTNRVRS